MAARDLFGPPGSNQHQFVTTQWTLILAASDLSDSHCREALETLCRIYWKPVYAFVRRRGLSSDQAEDLTQSFFANLLEKRALSVASAERGRFRSFLLASLKNFLANEWDRQMAQKRGGGKVVSMEEALPEPPAREATPEEVFDRTWALALLEDTWKTLEGEQYPGARERFDQLKNYLTAFGERLDYRQIASTLGLTEAAVKTSVYRLRRRFGQLLRERLEQTVATPSEVDREIHFLLDSLRA